MKASHGRPRSCYPSWCLPVALCTSKLQECTCRSESNMAKLQSPIHSAAANGSGILRDRTAFSQWWGPPLNTVLDMIKNYWAGQTIWGLVPVTLNYEFKCEPFSCQQVQPAAHLSAPSPQQSVVVCSTDQTFATNSIYIWWQSAPDCSPSQSGGRSVLESQLPACSLAPAAAQASPNISCCAFLLVM